MSEYQAQGCPDFALSLTCLINASPKSDFLSGFQTPTIQGSHLPDLEKRQKTF